MSYTPIFRVYVLKPPKGRERKHTLTIFRVGAADELEALTKVRLKRSEDKSYSGERIVGCARFGDAGDVIYDGSLTLTSAEVENRFSKNDYV